VALVVNRCRDASSAFENRFYPQRIPFAATAVLRFGSKESDTGVPSAVLEFYNPLASSTIVCADEATPLAADLTAPLAETLSSSPRTYFAGFVQPGGQRDESRLL